VSDFSLTLAQPEKTKTLTHSVMQTRTAKALHLSYRYFSAGTLSLEVR